MFIFPEIQIPKTKSEQAEKIREEIDEYLEEFSDEEAIDVLHAAETLIRIQFKGRMEMFEKLIQEVIEKNSLRGYYTRKNP